jgi:hypothetical protein
VAPFARRADNMTTIWLNDTSSNSSLELECPVGGVPKPSKSWQFIATDASLFSAPLRLDTTTYGDDSGSLRLNKLDELQQGVYACNATNEFGSLVFAYDLRHMATSDNENDNESTEPLATKTTPSPAAPSEIIATKSENIVLYCNIVTDDDGTSLSWWHNDKLLVDKAGDIKYSFEDNLLIVRNATRNDAGEYTCESTISSSRQSFAVFVMGNLWSFMFLILSKLKDNN